LICLLVFFFQAEDGIRDFHVTGVQTCALPILTLVKPDEKGRPLLLSPRTYVHGWDPAAAEKFDPKAAKEIPSDLAAGEIVLSDQIGRASCRERVWDWGLAG